MRLLFIIAVFVFAATACRSPVGDLDDAQRDYSGEQLAFRGAEGFGVDTPGGRGGEVIVVTTLNADGPGSLREAIERPEPRTIVFEVGGVIDLREALLISSPFITIAGESAPSPGITIIGAGIDIQTHDVVVRHLRVRPGDREDGPKPENRDAIQVFGDPSGDVPVYNVVIDHNSLSWAVDEVTSTWYPGVSDVTFSNNIIAEGLWNSLHDEQPHSKGLLIGDYSKRIAVIRNVFAHNNDRNPVLTRDVSALVVNNLVYNPGRFAMVMYNGRNCCPSRGTFIGNRVIAGAQTEDHVVPLRLTRKTSRDTKVYVEDSGRYESHYGDENLVDEPPVWVEPLTVRPSDDVETMLLREAGARPWNRDEIDERVLADVRNRTGKGPDTVAEAGGFPNHAPTRRSLDVPDDPHADGDGDGRTNLEQWLEEFIPRDPAP